MITTAAEYNKYLYAIQDANRPVVALVLPTDETIYHVDLNTRLISSPEFLSVETDHTAETIYFRMARFYENIDLTTMTCVIQYINANGKGGIYVVPYFDIETYYAENDILFPWCIDSGVTAAAGEVQYSIRFYSIKDDKVTLEYNLNTQIATSKVLHGMTNVEEEVVKSIPADLLEQTLARIAAIEGYIAYDTEERRFQVYWLNMFNEGAK